MGTTQIDRVLTVFVTTSVLGTLALGAAVVNDYNNYNHSRNQSQQVAVAPTDNGTGTDTAPTDNPTAGGGTVGNGGSGTTTGSVTTGGGGSVANLSNSQASSGIRNGTIYVGGIFDWTGPVDSTVERDTVRAYFDKVNSSGGINGLKLQLIACDGHYDPNVSHTCSEQMIDKQVLALVGNTFPAAEDQEVPFLTGHGIPLVGGLGTPAEYQQALSFPVSPSFAFGGRGLASLLKQNGYSHPAIVYISDVGWAAPVVDQIIAQLKANGITPTTKEAASATNDQAYDGHVANLRTKNDLGPCAAPPPADCPDSLIAATDPYSYTKLFQAMDRAPEPGGWHPPVIAGGLDKGNTQEAYGDQLDKAQSLTPFISPLDPAQANNATVTDYLHTVQQYYPSQTQALDVYTQIAWTAAMVFVQAAKDAGPNLTRASLVAALQRMHNFDTGWSAPLSYGSGGTQDPDHCYYFLKHDSKPYSAGGTWRQAVNLSCF